MRFPLSFAPATVVRCYCQSPSRAHVLPLADMHPLSASTCLCVVQLPENKAGLAISHSGNAKYDEYGPIRRIRARWRRASSASFVGIGASLIAPWDMLGSLFLGTRGSQRKALGGCGQGFAKLALEMRQLCGCIHRRFY